jgi:hypothetical protein
LLKQLLLAGASVNEKLLDQIIADFQAIAKNGEKEYFVASLKPAGLVHRGSISAYVTSEDKAIGDWICEGTGSLSTTFIRGGTNHAMAVDLQSFIFFDPNVGELKFGKDSDLRAFLNDMFPKNSAQVPAWQYVAVYEARSNELPRG